MLEVLKEESALDVAFFEGCDEAFECFRAAELSVSGDLIQDFLRDLLLLLLARHVEEVVHVVLEVCGVLHVSYLFLYLLYLATTLRGEAANLLNQL